MQPRLMMVPMMLMLAGCGGGQTVDAAALTQEVAPTVRSGLGIGEYAVIDGEPAITMTLQSPASRYGAAVVRVLAGRSAPGSQERQCTSLGVRLVPYQTQKSLDSDRGGRQLLPLVADAFERRYDVTCGVP